MTRIRGFDGLRALALLLVFFQHYTRIGQKLETGGYGVWLFFVLSGFLIVRILHAERVRIEAGETTRAGAVGRFFWRRTLRIFPIYYLAIAVMAACAAFGWVKGVLTPTTLWHLAYAGNLYYGHVADKWLGPMAHFWSLAIEEQFYLLAAPILLIFAPARRHWQICAGAVMLACTVSLYMRASMATEMALYNSSLINFGALAAGGWMGLSLKTEPGDGRRWWPGALLMALYGGLIWAMWKSPAFTPGVALLIAGLPLVIASGLAALMLRTVFLNQKSWLAAVLEFWPLRSLGRISYGFYLYHKLLPSWMVYYAMRDLGHPIKAQLWIEALAAFPISLLIAAASWWAIERPLMRFKDRPPRWPARLWGAVRPAPASA